MGKTEKLDKVNLVVVEGHAFEDSSKADDKADDMRNSREFNENYEDVCVIYDVPIQRGSARCYHDTPECKGELWQCQTCGELFCQTHWHETSKGRNVECVACERQRRRREKGVSHE